MQPKVAPLLLEARRVGLRRSCAASCAAARACAIVLFVACLFPICLLTACQGDSDNTRPGALDSGSADAGDTGPSNDAGQPDAGTDAGGEQVSACGEITSDGHCLSSSRVEICVTPAGTASPPYLDSYDCRIGETCNDADGVARCLLTSECVETETECRDQDTLKTCTAGAWTDLDCSSARCVKSGLGAVCAPDVATQTLSGQVKYHARKPNFDLTDWGSTPVAFPARGFAILSYVGGELLDATYTNGSGAFSVLGPATPTESDAIVVLCAGQDDQGQLAFAVGNPGYAPSTLLPREPFEPAPMPQFWSFSFALDAFANNDVITIPETAGSAAAHVYDTLRGVFTDLQTSYAPSKSQTVMVWASPGTKWSCGACMAPSPLNVSGRLFQHQVWLDGSADNQGYWSDAVSAHELGHYVMAAYGFPPAEGGSHNLAVPTNPGQGWSEGWATFFSSMHRNTGLYFDKQDKTFFWFDLQAREYEVNSAKSYPWQRPTAAAGLDQLIDENEVAALLRATQLAIGSKQPMLTALATERMREGPFERGYTLRTWSDPSDPSIYMTSGESIPYLADFFDALRCDDAISAEALDLVTVPATHYPYPSQTPLCR